MANGATRVPRSLQHGCLALLRTPAAVVLRWWRPKTEAMWDELVLLNIGQQPVCLG